MLGFRNEQVPMSRTSGHAVAEIIESEGVSHVFTVPGESIIPVLDGLRESPVEVISTRHEGGASFMAEAMAKASGQVSVCMGSRIPGASNLAIGLHTARQDSTPVVALVGQSPTRYRGREAWQEVDLVEFFRPIVKWSVEVTDSYRLTEVLRRAFALSRQGRPGPVVVSLPEDVLEEADRLPPWVPRLDLSVGKARPSAAVVEQIVDLLSSARRPFIIAGGGCRNGGSRLDLVSLAEALETPVSAAFRRHDVFPNDHRFYAGHLGMVADEVLASSIAESDVLLAIGTRLGELTTQHYRLPGSETKLIHVDLDEHAVFGGVATPQIGVVADPATTLAVLTEKAREVSVADPAGKRARAEDLHARYLTYSSPAARSAIQGVDPEGILRDLVDILPSDALLTNDAGTFAGWLHRYFRFNEGDSYLGPTSGSMGYGLPAAIAGKLAFPDKLVVSFSGDGGFLMTSAELETAVRYRIPVICLVFNNRRYEAIRGHQEKLFPGRPIATDLGDVDFATLAKGYGAYGAQVDSNGSFREAFRSAVASGRPAVLDLKLAVESRRSMDSTKTAAHEPGF